MPRTVSLPQQFQAEFASLRQELDPEVRAEGLVGLARRLENRDETEAAREIYAEVAQSAHSPPALQRCAIDRLSVLTGTGSIVRRAEFLGRGLAHHATDPVGIFSMLGAGLAFRAVRLGVLGCLAATPGSRFFTRGMGAHVLAGLAGFFTEVPAFTAAGRLGNAALGREQDWGPRAMGRELASGAIVLGALKGFGLVFGAFGRRWRTGQPVLSQAGMFSGILAAHQVEAGLGLRPNQDAAGALVEGLGTWVQVNAAGRLAQGITGENFRRVERELDLRMVGAGLESAPRQGLSRNDPLDFPLSAGAEGRTQGPPLPWARRLRGTLRNLFLSPMWMMMGAGGIGGFGPVPRIYLAPERGPGGRWLPKPSRSNTSAERPREVTPTPSQTTEGSLLEIYLRDFDSALQKRRQGLPLSDSEAAALRNPELRDLYLEREQLPYRRRPGEDFAQAIPTQGPTPAPPLETAPTPASHSPPPPAGGTTGSSVPSDPADPPPRVPSRDLEIPITLIRGRLVGLADLDLDGQALKILQLAPQLGPRETSLLTLTRAIEEFGGQGRLALTGHIHHLDYLIRRWGEWGKFFRNLERIPRGGRLAWARGHLRRGDGSPLADRTLSAYIRWGTFLHRNRSRIRVLPGPGTAHRPPASAPSPRGGSSLSYSGLTSELRTMPELLAGFPDLSSPEMIFRLLQMRSRLSHPHTSPTQIAQALARLFPVRATFYQNATRIQHILRRWTEWGPHFRTLNALPVTQRREYSRQHLRKADGSPYTEHNLDWLRQWGIFLWLRRREIPGLMLPGVEDPPPPVVPPRNLTHRELVQEIQNHTTFLDGLVELPVEEKILRLFFLRARFSNPRIGLGRLAGQVERQLFPGRLGPLHDYIRRLQIVLDNWREWAPHFEVLAGLPSRERTDYGLQKLRLRGEPLLSRTTLSYVIRWGLFLWKHRSELGTELNFTANASA